MNQTQEILQKRNDLYGAHVAENLQKRGFAAEYCPDSEAALKRALELIPLDSSVGYGGSLTINDLGLKEALRTRGNSMFDRDLAKNPQESTQIMHDALAADWFLMGSNAISEDGQLVNIDGNGNRVTALIYGPKNVLILCGINKVTKTLEDAYHRARNQAAPTNQTRFPSHNTPCTVTGGCADCNSPDCICNQIVITRRCNPQGRIRILLIGQALGF